MRLRPIHSSAIFLGLMLLCSGRAHASIIAATYDLTDFNKTNSTVTAPYEVVQLIGNTTAGTVTFKISLTGDNAGAKFSEFGFSAATGGSTSLGGYGKFNWVLDAASGKANRTTALSFTISGINTLVGNSNWTLTSDTGSSEILFSQTNKGNLFVSNYYPASGDNGFVSEPAFVGAPEPSTVLLFSLGTVGLSGLAFWRRRLHA
jgi:hypothetical protein